MLVKNVMYLSEVDVVMLLSLDIHDIIAFSERTSHGVAFNTYATGAMGGIGSNQVGLWYQVQLQKAEDWHVESRKR